MFCSSCAGFYCPGAGGGTVGGAGDSDGCGGGLGRRQVF